VSNRIGQMLDSMTGMSRNIRRNKSSINIAYLSLLMWMEEEIEHYSNLCNGIGPLIMHELYESMKIEEFMNPNCGEHQEEENGFLIDQLEF
jgi:hypothetical protein